MMDKLDFGIRKLGYRLSAYQLEQFETFYQELLDWNQRMNLTAITGYEDVQTKHFLDSLTVVMALPQTDKVRVIDVGTGAGMPGAPIKILFPEISLTLLDATAKKAAFLCHLKEKLHLDNTTIVIGRAEDVGHQGQYRERFDVVLSRAVAPLPVLVELTLPFCAVGGRFIAQKKGAIDTEISQANKAIALMGGKLREVKQIELEELPDERQLVIIDKISPTPSSYPRRPGVPAKKPIL